ncbi:hypothetical protein FIC_01270 [Flavobacteriaceae bacterium 3519-10]|nr:hypothetical protein FIC_01270 [Flavobacteriaceae bacterium 3519-10]
MKVNYPFLLLLLLGFSFSCNSKEDNCFTSSRENFIYIGKPEFTADQIRKEKPDYLQIYELKQFRSFKTDSIDVNSYDVRKEDEARRKHELYLKNYEIFNTLFYEQFQYYAKQKVGDAEYALGRNMLGYWLLKIRNNEPKAYFLGLSFSHYYFNQIQKQAIIRDGELRIEGSFVKIVKVPGLPGYDDYSAIEDGKLFRIKLADLEKDSDDDGYNDIFEDSFGLNPESADTDSDGTDDFNDLNPLYKSKKNKFTLLFEQLLGEYGSLERQDFTKLKYYFDVYETDCEHFQSVNPKLRTIFTSKSERKKSYYLQHTDVVQSGISKLKKDPINADKFYVEKWGSSFSNDLVVEFKNEKWIIKMIGGSVI